MFGFGFTFFNNGQGVSRGSAYDADAQAFFTAAGITDVTQKTATNQLVLDLKSANIWTKIKALYPFVGGDATKHSYNLVNTSLYQLTFTSGWTHSSNGATPNGTSAYASTGIKVSDFAPDSIGLAVYLRTNIDQLGVDVGVIDTSRFQLLTKYAGSIYSGFPNSNVIDNGTIANSNKFTSIGRVSTTSRKTFKNGTLFHTASETLTSTSGINTYDFKIGASGGSSITWYSSKENALTLFKTQLSDSEEANLYTAVQSFQTTLGRNV